MKEDQVRHSIRQYIVDTWLSGDSRGFDDETDLTQAGILDSFSTLDMAAFIDDHFSVQLEPSEINASSFRNISSLAGIVMGRLSGAT
jgi:acyl carrier protein